MKGQPEPIESISAVTLVTLRMDKAVAFYQALGFHLLYGGPEAPFTGFRVGGGYLNLQLDPAASDRRATWGRIVFWVGDVDATYRRALEARFAPQSAPTDAPWGERYFHIHDPDGHELSFARPLSPGQGSPKSAPNGTCGAGPRAWEPGISPVSPGVDGLQDRG